MTDPDGSQPSTDAPDIPQTFTVPRAAEVPIRLQVGERIFTTTKDTLVSGSAFFAALFSGRWNNSLPDGSWFIDADPALFEHILRYLRRGVFPLFFDIKSGHDHHRYLSLLEEARYFQISRLEQWLIRKRYLDAVRVETTLSQKWFGQEESFSFPYVMPAGATRECHLHVGTKNVYLCPRGIEHHRGSPGSCGRQCENARANRREELGISYEEEHFSHMLLVTNVLSLRGDYFVDHMF